MPQYYSSFPSGFEPAVKEFIERDMPGTQVLRIMDGAVEYRRKADPKEFPRWFNNSFLCLTTFPRALKDPLQHMVRLALQRGVDSDLIVSHMPGGAQTFRAIFMTEGLIQHAGLKTMEHAETFLSAVSGLRPGRAKPDVEFWFLYRPEGTGFLLMRLTQHTDIARELPQGELKPDISHLLCRMSNPRPSDVFLDPFAGYGGIARARTSWPAAKIIAADIAPLPQLRYALRTQNAEILKMDALRMGEIGSGSIDAIVCNPPWGESSPLPDPDTFYGKFAAEAKRVLKKDGRLVMLTALRRQAQAALELHFALENKLDVLVFGKKASVFVCRNVK